MRSAIPRGATWIRGNLFILALATVGMAAVVGVAWFAFDLTRPPDYADHGHEAYLNGQKRLHVQEARAQLAVLMSALGADRPAEGLAARAERILADLEWAIRPESLLGDVSSDIATELELLVEQIHSDDPGAGETLLRVRALAAGAGGTP